MFQTIVFYYSDMKKCDQKIKLIDSKLYVSTGNYADQVVSGSFRRFLLYRLRCVEITPLFIVPIDGMNINIIFDYTSYELNAQFGIRYEYKIYIKRCYLNTEKYSRE